MNHFASYSLSDFNKKFPDDEACLEYLAQLKWQAGYQCRRCGCLDAIKGYKAHYKRCRNCYYDESITANTCLHKIKFSMLKAFQLLYRLSFNKGISSVEASKMIDVNQKTAWLFIQKVQRS